MADATPPPTRPDGAEPPGGGPVNDLDIIDELQTSYLTYAQSVIVSRALPDVRDGLKPSQRRILVAMNDLGLGPTAATSKCAGIIGETMKRYHPHGDGSIYDSLVRMAQDWNLRVSARSGTGQLRFDRGPAARRAPVHRSAAIARGRRVTRRSRPRDRRFHRQLRRQVSRTAGPARPLPEPAREWFRRHRGWHRDTYPASQSSGNLPVACPAHRQPRAFSSRTDGDHTRPRFPHRRGHHGASGDRRRLQHRARQDHASRSRRGD